MCPIRMPLAARSEGPDQLLPREFSPAEQQAPGRDTSATGNLVLCPETHILSLPPHLVGTGCVLIWKHRSYPSH